MGQVENELFIDEALFDRIRKSYGVPVAGDIMVSAIGTIGACHIVRPNERFYYKDASVLRLHPKMPVCAKFIKLAFDTSEITDQLIRGQGSTVATLTISRMQDIRLCLPPLEEQKRIAVILDQADALRRLRARALDRLYALGQAIFHEMFGDGRSRTKKLELSKLIDVRSSLDDPRLPENCRLLHVGPEHIFAGSGSISWENVRTCQEDGVQSGKYHFQSGDIVFSKIRPYLNKVAIADRQGMCSADMYALVVDQNFMTTEFLHFVLGSANFLRYAETVSNRANIPKLNRSQLLAFECPVPDIESQRKFRALIDELRGVSFEAQSHLTRTEALFTSIQHRAFRGEL